MKPGYTFLSILISAQIASTSFALAVETKKSPVKATAPLAKTVKKSSKALVTKTSKATKTKPQAKAEAIKPKPVATTATTLPSVPSSAINAKPAAVGPSSNSLSLTAPTAPAAASIAKLEKKEEAKFYDWGFSFYPAYNTTAEAPKEGPRSEYMSYDVIAKFITGPILTVVWGTYIQDLVHKEDSEWRDLPFIFTMATPWELGQYLTLAPVTAVTVPLAKSTKEEVQLNYAANISALFGLNPKIGPPGMLLQFQTGYTKMNNEFTTSLSGEPITSYRFRQRINFWFPFTEKFYFKSRFEFDSNFSYENIVRNRFYHYEELEYNFLDYYGVSIGHSNEGSALKADSYESNLKFYDSESSEVYFSFNVDI